MSEKKKCEACGQSTKPRPVCPACSKEIIPPAHPGWATIQFFGFMGLCTAMLYGEATNFDETELTALMWISSFVAPLIFKDKIMELGRKLFS